MLAKEKEVAEKKGPAAVVRYWSNEITAARKREKEYRKEGTRIREIYNGQKKNRTPFNILYSNTETMLPALYGATPKPVVQRRFKDADPVARGAAMAGQRALEFLIDTNIEDYETFDVSMRDSVVDALLPGRGIARIKYEAEITQVPEGVGADGEPAFSEYKAWETVCTDNVAWDRVYFGFAKKWSKVPWVAFEHYVDKDEAIKLFGKEKAEKLQYTETDEQQRDEDGERKQSPADSAYTSERKTALVYEIWIKKDRKVCFFSSHYQDGYLKEEDDPLEMSGFFPMAKPLGFLTKTNDLMPSALYLLYENQASELNKISTRINRIVEAMKVRGAYDGSLGDTLNDLLKADDNTLMPTDNASNIAAEGGLDKYIWFMPLDDLVKVLQQLLIAREQCKQIIYEVTGISDIIRGASNAQETATAQQIKNQWGSLRIKMHQNEVRRYVRETLRLMLEVAGKKFSAETFAKMTGLPFVMREQKQQAQQIMVAVQQQMAMQPPGPDGKPQLPPQLQKTMAQAQQTLQAIDWESVLELLRDDLSRAYRIDIETNSTVQMDEQEDKQNMAEAMAAMGQYLKGVTPLVEQGIMPFEAAKSMLLAVVRRFRFGTEVEEEIKAMQAPSGGKDAEAQKIMAEAQKAIQAAEQKAIASEQKAKEAEAGRMVSEMEKKLAEREAEIERDKIKLEAEKAIFNLEKQVAQEQFKSREAQHGEKVQTSAKVSSLVEQSKKREAQIAEQAGGKVAQATQAIEGIVKAVQALEQNLVSVAERVESMGKREVVKMERVRGADGRLAMVRRQHADGTTSEVAVQ